MRIHNSISHGEEDFIPLDPKGKEIGMYACGPTVYDVPHLGHARSEVVFDLIRRYLEFKGYHVNYVHNYTDIDDKMINRANNRGIDIFTLAQENISEYEKMQEYLGVKEPSYKPRATEEIPEMIDFIQKLENKGYAYVSDGSVYFDTSKVEGYKKIFRKTNQLDENDEDDYSTSEYLSEKRNKEDFVLWKKKKDGEPFWKSPWGDGRPGWHIECSVMSMKYIGESIDIHGGGMDLRNPHHQNEIAQSEALTGKIFAKYWIHNGFLNIDDEKMSKSLGNFITVNDLRNNYPGKIVRFFLLSYQYRSPVNFSIDSLDEARKAHKRITSFYNNLVNYKIIKTNSSNPDSQASETLEISELKEIISKFYESMDSDFNTADAIGQLFKIIKIYRPKLNKKEPITPTIQKMIIDFLNDIDKFLNFIITKEEADSEWKNKFSQLVDEIVKYRLHLRKEKNYTISDDLRKLLQNLGIEINDKKNNSSWEFK